jgi:hypothetical protein
VTTRPWLSNVVVTLLIWAVFLGPTFIQAGHILRMACLDMLASSATEESVIPRGADGETDPESPAEGEESPADSVSEPIESEVALEESEWLRGQVLVRLSFRSSVPPEDVTFPPDIEPPTLA